MKKLIFWALLIGNCFGIYAQNEVFRIDSIPQQGILLNSGWKFHAGDNPDFADRGWKEIDPTKNMMEIYKPSCSRQ